MKTRVGCWATLAKMLVVLALVLGNLAVAMGHPGEAAAHFAGSHFHKSGYAVHFGVWNFGTYRQYAQYALDDQYGVIDALFWDYPNDHTEISVFDEAFGHAEWCGEHRNTDAADGHRVHSHSVYNRDCGGSPQFIQGVYCQEIAHAWSQDHHDQDNSCMGLTYYNQNGYYITNHDELDFNWFYQQWHR